MSSNLEGQTIDRRYLIIERLGGGAFGTTYIAEDLKRPDTTRCVVKQFTPIYDEPEQLKTAKRLFEEEARALNRLGEHPQIPRLLAYFEENQQFFLVQDFIDGHNLDTELKPGKHTSQSYVTELLRRILRPLAFVHQQGYIHRDLKPANLIRRRSDGQIFLIDFGAVKEKIEPKNINFQGIFHSTIVIGSHGYMPVEQIDGRPEFSSDIYAVGMIAIQALTGVAPMLLPKNRQGDVIWRDQLPDAVDYNPALLEIIDGMVCCSLEERSQSAQEVLERIDGLLSGKTISSPPVNPGFALSWFNQWGKLIGAVGLSIATAIIAWWLVGRKPDIADFEPYQSDEKNIAIEYPGNWDIQNLDGIFSMGVEFISPREDESDDFRERLVVEVEDLSANPPSLAEYSNQAVEEIKTNFAEQDLDLQTPQSETLANRPAVSVVYEVIEDDLKIKRMQVWTLSNNQAYIITYRAESNQYGRYLDTAEKMIKTFEIQ